MRAEEIDALLGGEAQRLADKYTSVPLDFMDGYGWAVTQICRLFRDAVPVRHGKWIYSNDFHWYVASCNKCGYQRRTDIKAEGWNQWNYCPNCGARMDEE